MKVSLLVIAVCSLIVITVTLMSVPSATSRFAISDEVAATLIGGETEVPNSCCIPVPRCDLTEILCSANPMQACKDYEAWGYRLGVSGNRDECAAEGSSTGKTCTENEGEDEEATRECAYDMFCEYDESIEKCVPFHEDPVLAPLSCDDNCN